MYRLGASVPDTPRSHLATQRAIGPSHPPPHLSNAGARLCTHGRRIDALAPSLADRAAHGLVTTLHRLTCLVVMAMVTARTRACVGCATAVRECTRGESRISYTAPPGTLHHSPPPTFTRRHAHMCTDLVLVFLTHLAHTSPHNVRSVSHTHHHTSRTSGHGSAHMAGASVHSLRRWLTARHTAS